MPGYFPPSRRWLLLLLAVYLLLAGCAALPTPVVYDRPSFAGMNALVGEEAPGRPLHVLLVHGMGTPTPNAASSTSR